MNPSEIFIEITKFCILNITEIDFICNDFMKKTFFKHKKLNFTQISVTFHCISKLMEIFTEMRTTMHVLP